MAIPDRLRSAARRLCRDLEPLRFAPPVTCVYNPLEYARRNHDAYLRRYASGPKRVVYLGMNPGPYGMAQTGVPFGEVAHVRDWLGIEGPVDKPRLEHPRRPVQGFDCPRSEVSGARLWGAIADHYRRPERFFRHAFLANYCPLVFMEESGRNRTPDKLPAPERERLFAVCDDHLRRLVRILEPRFVIGIGRFAESRAREALPDFAGTVATVLHPSPASPAANRGWAPSARADLQRAGVCPGASPVSPR